ncbi:caspase-7-like [Crassostrea virginica]|uniref:Caspase-7-like n=1 Tax=Crassostrea virginica TaxID=6565 RepID=A0A8B8D6K5_CRAVI|nr:caspase-7-like [Crassostrea virginica]
MSKLRYTKMDRIGRVLIVNNQVYHKPHAGSLDCKECEKTTRPQDIAKEDGEVNKLVKIFEDLGFKDIDGGTNKFVYKDQSKTQMIELLEKVAKQDFSQDYCFICVILSYGKDGVITCVPMNENDSVKNPPVGMQLPLAELQNCLKGEKCKGLLAKPKIFMLQLDHVPGDRKDGGSEALPAARQVKIPREADFLTYTCDMNNLTHYYGISAWIEGLEKYVLKPQKEEPKGEPMEIQRLLTRMTNIFKSKYETAKMTVEYPCVTSLLTKQVFLTKTT